MSVELPIISYLNADTTLDNLLTATAGNPKIYPDTVLGGQSASSPYITYNASSLGSTEENLKEQSIEFDIASTSFITCQNIGDRLMVLLDKQDSIRSVISSTSFRYYWMKHINGNTFRDTDTQLYHRILEFDLKYNDLTSGVALIHSFTIPIFGTFVDEKVILNAKRFINAAVIKKLGIHIDEAPTGADITVDIILDNAEQSRTATLSAGSRDEETTITDLDVATGVDFGLKIKGVGSITVGEGGYVEVFHT